MRKFQVSFAAGNKGIAAPTMDAIMLISKVRMSFLTARANNTKTSASRTELYPVKIEMKRGPLSAVEQHELFHDVTLNKPDDLGDYREDYLAIYPN